MKSNFRHLALTKLCGWFGISRQAYYQNNRESIAATLEEHLVLQQVRHIRTNHHQIGTRKLYEMMQPFLFEHRIKVGRDALFSMLAVNHLLVRKRKRRIQTTNSQHWFRKYPNLIRGLVPSSINQLWVSDITYWKICSDKHLYISFITDAYSRKVVGYHVAQSLEAVESVQALQMALSSLRPEGNLQLTHHSDRGMQYCSHAYVKLLQDYNIRVSMTENGDPLENAIAERVNGIIKEEYLDHYQIKDITQAEELLKTVIELYNRERPHMSISNLTPNQVHYSQTEINPQKLWKNYYRKQPMFVNPVQD